MPTPCPPERRRATPEWAPITADIHGWSPWVAPVCQLGEKAPLRRPHPGGASVHAGGHALLVAVSAELAQKALDKLRQGAPYSVAAVLVCEVTPPGLDGARWRFYVSDGHESGFVELGIAATNGGEQGMDIDPRSLNPRSSSRLGALPVRSDSRGWSPPRRSRSPATGCRTSRDESLGGIARVAP